MNLKINFNAEEKFLIKILFSEENTDKLSFKKINLEKLVIITSSFHLIPALYLNLKKKNLISEIPTDLKNYLKEIYLLNKNRNKILIYELNDLQELLKKSDIKFKLIKGSKLICEKVFDDYGERMVGDIDYLIDKKNLNKNDKILTDSGFEKKFIFKFWKTRHPAVYFNKNKIFRVEPHIELVKFSKKDIINPKEILNKKSTLKSDIFYNALTCIYSWQINDHGSLKANYNLKAFYDFFNIIKFNKEKLSLPKNKFVRRFLIMAEQIGMIKYREEYKLSDKLFFVRLNLKKKYRNYFLIDNFFCKIIILSEKRFNQLIELIFNKGYRIYLFKKLIRS